MKPLRKAASGSPVVERTYPALCEPVLEERAANWDVRRRRRMADVFMRWSQQLRFSAEFIERFEAAADLKPPQERDAQLLELAAQMEEQAGLIRERIGLVKPVRQPDVGTLAFAGN